MDYHLTKLIGKLEKVNKNQKPCKTDFCFVRFCFFKNAVQTQLIKIFSQFNNIFSNSIDFFFKMLYNFCD